ncbi:MAG: phosphoglucosamine mutase [Flavobacteriales bacterium]|nr:phosphoglucosamine mutase [Flavobacteriales bacterium]
MTLIKSISGFRGTIGGSPGDNLTPPDVVKFTAAYGTWLRERNEAQRLTVVVGRDARRSGEMVNDLVVATLCGLGIDVVDLGLTTTPTVEVAVPLENAAGGIVLTASHNPGQWNALKLLNERGEFISAADGRRVLELAETDGIRFADIDQLGIRRREDYLDRHLEAILALPLVNVKAIRAANFKVAVDGVNSTGGIYVPALLEKLGVAEVRRLWCDPTGHFPHNPEPLPEHLTALSSEVRDHGCHLGISVDPDVDRLALVCEDGSMFGEEYTLVAVADYVLKHTPGNTVSNLSSTRALRDVTQGHGHRYEASAVGEVNVVSKMKEINAVIGGEGNGGVIYPEAHYGRDALVGIALFLSHLAETGFSMSALRNSYPAYVISKNKIDLEAGMNPGAVLSELAEKHRALNPNLIDGVKFDLDEGWVHLRMSNTEPIIRIYVESGTREQADQLAQRFMNEIRSVAEKVS